MTRPKIAFSLLGAAALTAALAACGDDDSTEDGSSADYCNLYEEIGSEYEEVNPDDPGAFADFGESMQKMADAAPSDIKEDWQTLADGFNELAELDVSDVEDPEVQQKLQEFQKLEPVNKRLEEHIQSECGIEP